MVTYRFATPAAPPSGHLSRIRVRESEERIDLVHDGNDHLDGTRDLRLLDEDVSHVDPTLGRCAPETHRVCRDLGEIRGRSPLHLGERKQN